MIEEFLSCIATIGNPKPVADHRDIIPMANNQCVDADPDLKKQLEAQGSVVRGVIEQNRRLRFENHKLKNAWKYD